MHSSCERCARDPRLFRDPDFGCSRFERFGDVYETSLLGQRAVFISGGQAISDFFTQSDAVAGWVAQAANPGVGA